MLGLFAVAGLYANAQPIFTYGEDSTLVPIPHPDDSAHLWLRIQDSQYVYLVSARGNLRPARSIAAAYTFDMVYDSTFLVSYDFTECLKNGRHLTLKNWKKGRKVNASARLLSFNSATDTFTCRTGDTLSFYRDLYWKELASGRQDTANYYALDSLDYTVELVRLSDSARVAILDTIGILANTTMGPPRIHGMHPLMATVRYIVPQSLDGATAFIRVLVFHRGGGPHWFARTDDITFGLSNLAANPDWRVFVDLFNPLVPKISAERLTEAAVDPSRAPRLDVVSGAGRFLMTFDCAPNSGQTLISVFDASGQQLYTPYVTTGMAGSAHAGYSYPVPGAYFIALYHDGRPVRVRKVIVQ